MYNMFAIVNILFHPNISRVKLFYYIKNVYFPILFYGNIKSVIMIQCVFICLGTCFGFMASLLGAIMNKKYTTISPRSKR